MVPKRVRADDMADGNGMTDGDGMERAAVRPRITGAPGLSGKRGRGDDDVGEGHAVKHARGH